MNPVPPCGCCLPAYCNACRTSCPTAPTCSVSPPDRKLTAEPQNKNQPECCTNNCVIFGGHDVNPFPEYSSPAKHIKVKDENHNSLGSPIGLVASNVNFKTEGNPTDIIQARFATYLKAFARLHLNAETTWTPILIDDIMKEGILLYTTSEKNGNKLDSPVSIYTASEKNVLREFEMNSCNFQVELMPKFTLNTADSAEIGGNGDVSNNLILEDLKTALNSFFRQHKYCLLTVRSSFYIMIWRSRGVYFIFDVCGRRVSDFRIDQDEGVAMLICLKTLENVRHLIVNLSSLRITDPISIREMKIVKVITPSGGVIQRDYGTRTHQYQVVNDDYAYLKAKLHLTLNKADLLRNRSALPVGISAMVVSKIDHPATWNTKMLDKILCFGVNFCQAYWRKCVITDPIDVNEFPCIFNMAQFRISIELIARKYKGIWRCVPGFKFGELAEAIEKAFEVGDQRLLLQINYQMYAIWRNHGFIYLLDPYRHRILGNDNESIYEQMEKSATVRMFGSFEVFMNTFNHMLLDSNRTIQFLIHLLKIKNIQHKMNPEEAQLDIDGEVISINEHICFEEAEDLCQKSLGEISDYEDLKSDVDEMELKTSSSEAEDVMEEEEAIAGAAEELEGLESSSSGDDDTGHKKKGIQSKAGKANKGRKVGGGKKKREGKTSTGNQGKGEKGSKKRAKVNDDISSDEEDSIKKTPVDTSKNQKESFNKNKAKDNNDMGKDGNDKDKGKTKAKPDGNKGNDGRSNEEEYNKANDKFDKSIDKNGKDQSKDGKEGNKIKGKDGKDQSKDDKEGNKIKGKDADKDTKDLDKLRNKDNSQTEVGKWVEKEKSATDKNKDDTLDKNRDINKYSEKDIEQNEETDKKKDLGKGKYDDNDSGKKKEKDEVKNEGKGNQRDIKKESVRNKYNKEKDILIQTRTKLPHDGAEADDENEDNFLKNTTRYCFSPNPNNYPGYFKYPMDMAVVGSESGSYASICKLFQAGFEMADRILTMTPWGNFVVFRCLGKITIKEKHYFIFHGCTCNVNRFRHLDLSVGTAGLICFEHMHNVIEYIRQVRKRINKENRHRLPNVTVDEICHQYCS